MSELRGKFLQIFVVFSEKLNLPFKWQIFRGKDINYNKDDRHLKRINQISSFLPYHRRLMGLTRKSWMTIAGSTQPSTFVASTKARTSEYLNWIYESYSLQFKNLMGFMRSPWHRYGLIDGILILIRQIVVIDNSAYSGPIKKLNKYKFIAPINMHVLFFSITRIIYTCFALQGLLKSTKLL